MKQSKHSIKYLDISLKLKFESTEELHPPKFISKNKYLKILLWIYF